MQFFSALICYYLKSWKQNPMLSQKMPDKMTRGLNKSELNRTYQSVNSQYQTLAQTSVLFFKQSMNKLAQVSLRH